MADKVALQAAWTRLGGLLNDKWTTHDDAVYQDLIGYVNKKADELQVAVRARHDEVIADHAAKKARVEFVKAWFLQKLKEETVAAVLARWPHLKLIESTFDYCQAQIDIDVAAHLAIGPGGVNAPVVWPPTDEDGPDRTVKPEGGWVNNPRIVRPEVITNWVGDLKLAMCRSRYPDSYGNHGMLPEPEGGIKFAVTVEDLIKRNNVYMNGHLIRINIATNVNLSDGNYKSRKESDEQWERNRGVKAYGEY